MTRVFNGVEFTEVTAICAEFAEDGRRKAILVHDINDEDRNGDGVCFEIDTLPEDEVDAENILESVIDTDYETLDSVELTGKVWSVELEANMWNDDTFTGTFEECVEYCNEYDYKVDGVEARIAEIDTEDGFCYQIVEEV